MAKKITGKYLAKNTANGSYADITTLFDGVVVLAVEGFDSLGKALNVYSAQWIDSQTEDFLITTRDENDNPVVIRENVAIKVVFAVSQRYADTTIDPQGVYDSFLAYLTGSDVWIASRYFGKQVHCFAQDKVDPKTVKLHRGGNSYLLGEITLHTLEKPTIFN